MENDMIAILKKRSENDYKSLLKFSDLVDELELLAIQNPQFFKNKVCMNKYHNLWSELEIINALALNEYEEKGCPFTSDKIWKKKYLKDAKLKLNDMIDFLLNMVEYTD